MEKSEMMDKFLNGEYYNLDGDLGMASKKVIKYVRWLESKAAAYDRVMSGDKTPKDIVNFLGKPGVITDDGDLLIFDSIPIVNMCFDEQTGEPYDDIKGAKRIAYIDGKFDSGEYDDVVLPDSMEESDGTD